MTSLVRRYRWGVIMVATMIFSSIVAAAWVFVAFKFPNGPAPIGFAAFVAAWAAFVIVLVKMCAEAFDVHSLSTRRGVAFVAGVCLLGFVGVCIAAFVAVTAYARLGGKL